MYNRYMRNDDGTYIRVPEEEPGRRSGQSQTPPDGGQDRRDGREHSPSQDHGSQGHGSPDEQGHSSGQDHGSQGHGSPDRQGHSSGQDHDGQGHEPGARGHTSGGSGHWEPPPAGGNSWFDTSPPPSGGRKDGLTGFLRHFLDQWHLDSVDTGDLLLLGLLFFLFREDADEELLVALGLLLIL